MTRVQANVSKEEDSSSDFIVNVNESDTQSITCSTRSETTSEYISSETSEDREFVVSDTDQLSQRSSSVSETDDLCLYAFNTGLCNGKYQEVNVLLLLYGILALTQT